MFLAVILILVFLAALIVYCYYRSFYHPIPRPQKQMELLEGEQYKKSKQYMTELINEFRAKEFEAVEIKSFDGLKLCGKYYHTSDDAPLQILCHGYKGSPERDFCGGSKLAFQAGHNVLAIVQRAHGESDGRTISFGINERKDLLAWINYANKRFGTDTDIILSGVSMGAATVLMASGVELPENVRCIMADCPYSSPYAIIRKVCADMKLPPAPLMPFIKLAAKLIGHFDLCECSAEEAVRLAKIPILLIHGEDDRFVPCDMSRAIAENSSLIQFETFPNAGHGLSFIEDEERYTKLVSDFIEKTL